MFGSGPHNTCGNVNTKQVAGNSVRAIHFNPSGLFTFDCVNTNSLITVTRDKSTELRLYRKKKDFQNFQDIIQCDIDLPTFTFGGVALRRESDHYVFIRGKAGWLRRRLLGHTFTSGVSF